MFFMENEKKLTRNTQNVDISVILPVFNEEKNVANLVDELVTVLKGMNRTFEIIAINVPGKDNSYAVVQELGKNYEQVYPLNIRYLQTKGYQKGYQYMLGFRNAKGNIVVQMDSDYQDDPKDLPKFLAKLQEGYDLVVGWKQDRKDPFFYKLTSLGQNFLSRLVTGVQVHDKNCGYKAYSRAAVDSVKLFGMNYRDIPMQLAAKGFKITEVPINNRKRISGKSNFTFINRLLGGTIDFLATLVVSIMIDKPFRIWGGIGIGASFVGFLMLIGDIVWYMFSDTQGIVTGGMVFLAVLSAVAMIKGVIFMAVGVVTEYMRSLKEYSLHEYAILNDPKGVLSNDS